jgi:hypothetical protein
MRSWLVAVGTVLVLTWTSTPARASLGDAESSVRVDREKMSPQVQVQLKVLAGEKFRVHELQLATGTRVRQLVSPAGRVFAITWSGPFMPDLQQLLGRYFAQYAAALTNRTNRRGPIAINDAGLVLENGGHMRAWVGRAWVPELLPAGTLLDEIR